MDFCNPFDVELFRHGPAAVFLPDRKGEWKVDPSWTRDAWGRAPGPHAAGLRFLLLRDHATGFVTLVAVTSPTLIERWPRADVRVFDDLAAALAARAACGVPPVHKEPWA